MIQGLLNWLKRHTLEAGDSRGLRVGLRENLHQFILLVIVNAFIGSIIGLERSILGKVGEAHFLIEGKTALLSFIVVFGLSKAITNYFSGLLAAKIGRKPTLIVGWFFCLPALLLLIFAESWRHILWANLFLGVSQGLCWSTAVIMKIDLVGPQKRGLAMGLNEFAGYGALALSAMLSGAIAETYGLYPYPFYVGGIYFVAGFGLSLFWVRETKAFAHIEAGESARPMALGGEGGGAAQESRRSNRASRWGEGLSSIKKRFFDVSFFDKNLSACVQAGFFNNFNDGMIWGLFPFFLMSLGYSLGQSASMAALYPAVWGLSQIFTGPLSDRFGRRPMIVFGMLLQGAALMMLGALSEASFSIIAGSSLLLGLGTAIVYPTLLAAIGDFTEPLRRAEAIGIYRFWRDLGYAIGAVLSGLAADALGVSFAIFATGVLTVLSGLIARARMTQNNPH